MYRISARFRVVTPCFLGADESRSELRLPSIRGALRFWWRALQQAARGREEVAAMRAREERLFDGAGGERVLMSLEEIGKVGFVRRGSVLRDRAHRPAGPGMRYLGHGLMEGFGKGAARLRRSCLLPPLEFVLRLAAVDRQPLIELLPALGIFGLLGALGSRSRKGYGSVNLVEIRGDVGTPWPPLRTVEDYRRRIGALLAPRREGDEPGHSAFSGCSRLELVLQGRRGALDVLECYGREMVRYRSWGRRGRVLEGENSERLFPEDHDWMRNGWHPRDFHPRRAVFGLPHGEGKRRVTGQRHRRRASPLLFHVHGIREGWIGVACLLRSSFLPPGEKVRAAERTVPCRPDWKVIADFLDRFRRNDGGRTLWPHE